MSFTEDIQELKNHYQPRGTSNIVCIGGKTIFVENKLIQDAISEIETQFIKGLTLGESPSNLEKLAILILFDGIGK